MPESVMWPHEANTITDDKIQFKAMTLTIREYFPAKDGVSKAGYNYHLPPRVAFEEDIEREEWSWKVWDDKKGLFEDYDGIEPVSGDIVQAKLSVSAKKTGEGYYYNVNDISYGVNVRVAEPPKHSASAPSGDEHASSVLSMIPLEQRIAAIAMTNTLLLPIWSEVPDGDEWKETIREAVKIIALQQIPSPPLLKEQAQTQETLEEVVSGIAAEAKQRDPFVSIDQLPPVEEEEDVEELQW